MFPNSRRALINATTPAHALHAHRRAARTNALDRRTHFFVRSYSPCPEPKSSRTLAGGKASAGSTVQEVRCVQNKKPPTQGVNMATFLARHGGTGARSSPSADFPPDLLWDDSSWAGARAHVLVLPSYFSTGTKSRSTRMVTPRRVAAGVYACLPEVARSLPRS